MPFTLSEAMKGPYRRRYRIFRTGPDLPGNAVRVQVDHVNSHEAAHAWSRQDLRWTLDMAGPDRCTSREYRKNTDTRRLETHATRTNVA